MTGIGLWNIRDQAPVRLSVSSVGLEQQLEEWIERDPSLLEQGLTIVGRQIRTEGGPLDLLAIDRQGRWVLIEIKRDRLRREVLSQAIDYASCLHALDAATLQRHCDAYLAGRGGGDLALILRDRGRSLNDDEELELVIYLVGTGVDPGLERMVSFLGDQSRFEIRMVTFSVFEDAQKNLLLAREIHEQPLTDSPGAGSRSGGSAPSLDDLFAKADENGVGPVVRPIVEAAMDVGLYPKRYSKSVMIAPPQHKSRCLIYVPIDREELIRDGSVTIASYAEAFEEFFGIPADRVMATLGQDGRFVTDEAAAQRFAEGLRRLFAQVE